jgi:hydrogenase maturation protease
VKTLLLGLGNDLLSDDGVGLLIAAALRERMANQKDLTVLETAEMGLSLLDLVTGYDSLVLVDAVQTGKASAGSVHELDDASLPSVPAISPHFLGIGEALALGHRLGIPVPSQVQIFAIEVQDPFTVGTRLTPPLAAALPGIVERIANRLLGNRLNSVQEANRVSRRESSDHEWGLERGGPK